ncbi:ADP-ribosyltransferase [Bacillus sp. FSL R12-0069]|uniref:ADP-ribosyltransferase n=1 Tax=Bacillus sp. FSL R12-0069 TaxID=2975342 RepID=UPI0030FC4D14
MKKTKLWLLSFLVTSLVIVGVTNTSFFSKTTYAAQKSTFKKTFGKVFKKNKKAASDWGDQHYSKWIKNLSEGESKDLKGYTGSHYDSINTYLRTNKGKLIGSAVDEKIKNIDSALKKARVPENITVYRRVTDWQFDKDVNTLRPQNEKHQFGKLIDRDAFSEIRKNFYNKTFTSDGYMSTSLSQDPHESFTKHPILLKISVPAGTEAGFIDKLSGYDQVELLIQRGYKFRYTSFDIEKDPSGKEYVTADVELRR